MDKIVKKIDKIVLKLKDRLATNETVHAALMGELSKDKITEFFTGESKGIFIATETRLLFFEYDFFQYDSWGVSYEYSIISTIETLPAITYAKKWYSQIRAHQVLHVGDNKGDVYLIIDHNHKKRDVERFVEFVRNNIRSSRETANQDTYDSKTDDVLSQIEKLSELKDKGIITEDEFIGKKEKLLTKI